MSHGKRWAWTVMGLLAVIIAAVLVSLYLDRWQISHSEDQWCDTLRLLTARPVPRPPDPGINQAREQEWLFYQDLIQLRHRFGCG